MIGLVAVVAPGTRRLESSFVSRAKIRTLLCAAKKKKNKKKEKGEKPEQDQAVVVIAGKAGMEL